MSHLFVWFSIRTITGQHGAKQAGVSELSGGGRLRHAGRHRLRQKHSPNQGEGKTYIVFWLLPSGHATADHLPHLSNSLINPSQTEVRNRSSFLLITEISVRVRPCPQRQKSSE